jgi:hypothetical protein
MQILDEENIKSWLPEKDRYRRYIKNDDRYLIRSNLKNRCLRLWINPVITWDAKVVPCCFDKDADHVMGDLNSASFKEIWHGGRFSAFRGSILKHRRGNIICRNCTSGLKDGRSLSFF